MTLQVSDLNSNYEENIQRWARVLGAGEIRRKIFLMVYSSRKERWSAEEIAERTGLTAHRVATQGRLMASGGLFEQLEGPRAVYKKISAVHHAKQRILRLAGDAQARENIPTKRNAKVGNVSMSKTVNNVQNAGVFNAGNMSGTITGNSQQNRNNESAQQLLEAVKRFKEGVENTPHLSLEQREDATNAASDLEAESTKPEGSRSLSKVRNAVAALKMLASGTQALHTLYDQFHPFVTSHFHLPGSTS